MTGSKIYLKLVSGWKGKFPAIPTILRSPAACVGDYLPIKLAVVVCQAQSGRVKEVFLPTPYRMKKGAVQAAVQLYNAQLPRLAAKVRACGSTMRFDEHVDEPQTIIRKHRMTKLKLNKLLRTVVWSATVDNVAKWRSKMV